MKKILVIKEDTEGRERLCDILRLAGYEVFASSSAQGGIRDAQKIIPDLILCDEGASDFSEGTDVLTSIRSSRQMEFVPFIVLGTSDSLQAQHRNLAQGADDYLHEPLESVDLLDTVAIRLRKSQKIERSRSISYSSFKEGFEGFRILDRLSENRELRTYGRKEVIFSAGQAVRYLYLIQSGSVKQYKSNQMGKELVTDVFKTGDFFGAEALVFGMVSTTNAMALEKSQMLLIPREAFLQALREEPHLDALMLNHLAFSIQLKERRMLSIAYDSVRKRIADALLSLSEDLDDENRGVKMLREDISYIVGTAKESVSRILSEFRSKNLIEISSGKINILQRERLAKIMN